MILHAQTICFYVMWVEYSLVTGDTFFPKLSGLFCYIGIINEAIHNTLIAIHQYTYVYRVSWC